MFEDADLIHSYPRADALVDVTPSAKEAGIRYPVALTIAAWARCVVVPPGVAGQDEAGRLWDLLWVMRGAIRRAGSGNAVHFALHVRDDSESVPPLVQLKVVCGPGDDGAPVLTVMLPGED